MRRGSARYGIALVALALSATPAVGADPVKKWLAFVGGSSDQDNIVDEAAGIALDQEGGVYVVGSGRGGVWGSDWDGKLKRASTGGTNVLVAKLGSDGKPAWYAFLGGTRGATGVALSGSALYVVANTEGDLPAGCPLTSGEVGVVGKVVELPTWEFSRTCVVDQEGKPIAVNAIAVDATGNPFVAGKLDGKPCVAKLSPENDTVVWSKPIGQTNGQANGIAVDTEGRVYVTGKHDVPVSGGSESRPFVASKPVDDSEFSYQDIGPDGEEGNSIALGAPGVAYVAGNSARQTFVKKVVWQGATIQVAPKQWTLREVAAGSSNDDVARSIAVHAQGGSVDVYVTGDTFWEDWEPGGLAPWVKRTLSSDPLKKTTEAWVARLDSDLDLTWWTFMGNTDLDVGSALALDASGNVYVTGHGTLPWPLDPWGTPTIEHSPGGSWDFYVVRFDAGSCAPEDACDGNSCLAKGAEEWGTYVRCVQYGVAKHYRAELYRDDLKECRNEYFDRWKPCSGPRFTDNGDTVTDNLTALVWEKKTNTVNPGQPHNESDLHDVNNVFTWSPQVAPWTDAGTAFGTFLHALNSGDGFAGSKGWRLPTVAELQTLMNASENGVLPDFPNVNSTGGYWSATSSPYIEGNCDEAAECAWDVIFENGPGVRHPHDGNVGTNGKTGGRHVRAVRGGW